MGSFSAVHWLIVIAVLLLVFGPKRLSEVGKGLGQGIKNFKRGMEEPDAPPLDATPVTSPRLEAARDREVVSVRPRKGKARRP